MSALYTGGVDKIALISAFWRPDLL